MKVYNNNAMTLFISGFILLIGLAIIRCIRMKICVKKVKGAPKLSNLQVAAGFALMQSYIHFTFSFMTVGRTIVRSLQEVGEDSVATLVYAFCLFLVYTIFIAAIRFDMLLFTAFLCSSAVYTEIMSEEEMYKCRWIIKSYYRLNSGLYKVALCANSYCTWCESLDSIFHGIYMTAPQRATKTDIAAITYVVYKWCKAHSIEYKIWYNARRLMLAFEFEGQTYAMSYSSGLRIYKATGVEDIWPGNAKKFNMTAVTEMVLPQSMNNSEKKEGVE